MDQAKSNQKTFKRYFEEFFVFVFKENEEYIVDLDSFKYILSNMYKLKSTYIQKYSKTIENVYNSMID